jgi:hypothetical protein
MTWYVIVDPKKKTVERFSGTFMEAKKKAGLNGVDFGMLTPSVSVVVYEYGMFDPPEEQSYFAMGGRLFAGTAVLLGVDKHGEDRDLSGLELPPVIWFDNTEEIEAAIARGEVVRPHMAVNNEVFWKWPEPREKPEGR